MVPLDTHTRDEPYCPPEVEIVVGDIWKIVESLRWMEESILAIRSGVVDPPRLQFIRIDEHPIHEGVLNIQQIAEAMSERSGVAFQGFSVKMASDIDDTRSEWNYLIHVCLAKIELYPRNPRCGRFIGDVHARASKISPGQHANPEHLLLQDAYRDELVEIIATINDAIDRGFAFIAMNARTTQLDAKIIENNDAGDLQRSALEHNLCISSHEKLYVQWLNDIDSGIPRGMHRL